MAETIESPRVDVAPCFPTNPGIFALGQRKDHVLAHEIGAGSLCRNCDCPGLDLHFWRKICKECGCRMDEHDVLLPNQYDHGQIIIGRLFEAKEHFEKEFKKIDERRSSLANSGYASNVSSQQASPKGRSVPTAVYNYKIPSEKESKTSVEYAWVPVPDKILVEKYMNALPVDERPIAGTVGEENRKSRLQYQLPLYDLNVDDSRFTNENDQKALNNFVENVKKNIIGVGTVFEIDNKPMLQAVSVDEDEDPKETMRKAMEHLALHPPVTECHKCHDFFADADVGVKTDHGKCQDAWHPNCFRCATCDQLLVDPIYFHHEGKNYCGRHYADKIYPRCNGCDELIFANEYTWAEEKAWHVDHFACYKCDLKLGGHRYMTKDEQPYCIPCYMDKFAKVCEACTKKIEPDEKRLNYKEYHWHANPDCFKCATCKTDLMGHKFILKHPNLYCSSQCRTNHTELAK